MKDGLLFEIATPSRSDKGMGKGRSKSKYPRNLAPLELLLYPLLSFHYRSLL